MLTPRPVRAQKKEPVNGMADAGSFVSFLVGDCDSNAGEPGVAWHLPR
jgi:hypothetical protein